MNRISNKHKRHSIGEWCKHPRPFLKRLGNSRLRINPLDAESSKYQKKKIFKRFTIANRCLFCLDYIPSQWKDSTFKHHGTCKNCGAVKQGDVSCSKCRSNNIWLQNTTYMCKRCGKNWHKI